MIVETRSSQPSNANFHGSAMFLICMNSRMTSLHLNAAMVIMIKRLSLLVIALPSVLPEK